MTTEELLKRFKFYLEMQFLDKLTGLYEAAYRFCETDISATMRDYNRLIDAIDDGLSRLPDEEAPYPYNLFRWIPMYVGEEYRRVRLEFLDSLIDGYSYEPEYSYY